LSTIFVFYDFEWTIAGTFARSDGAQNVYSKNVLEYRKTAKKEGAPRFERYSPRLIFHQESSSGASCGQFQFLANESYHLLESVEAKMEQ